MARKILLETGYIFNPTTAVASATGTVGSIIASATSPWAATITGMTSTNGLAIGSFFTATVGTGSLGAAGTYRVTAILSTTSITFSAIGGTTPVAGTVTNITPLARQIVIPRYIPRERLVLVTNTTTNQVIYNFSDPSLSATTYNGLVTGASGVTSLILNYNTVAMASTDTLQITLDEYDEKFSPSEAYIDPVNKLRTSQPQALIDTDFEYGTQITKWENLTLVNNRPSTFASAVPIAGITGMTMTQNTRTVTVALPSTAGLAVGTVVSVQDSNLPIANGNFVIETLTTNTSFTYTAEAVNLTTLTSIFDTTKTLLFANTLYTGAQIGVAPTIALGDGTAHPTSRVLVTTTVPHALAIGNEIYVTGITGTNPPNGNFAVASVITPTQFAYYANPIAGVPSGLTATSSAVYLRPQAQYIHRAFDGGVLFSTNSSSNNSQAIRQTRRYFRYQSGKGVQFSTGTILRPYATVDALTASGTTVTVQTREPHNIQPGATIRIESANEAAYNGTFTVTNVTGITTFTYTALSAPSPTTASGQYTLSVLNWINASNRLGGFDQQNGMFWEYDGQNLYAVRRQSVFQLSGRISVTSSSNTVTQTNAAFPTAFAKQLVPGDYIVIRGMSYKVLDIASDTSMTISPGYRGATATSLAASKTTDTRILQSQFNIDRLDGTGPSGYRMDLSRMQMFYIDYSWYGAGFIRFGVRGPNGDVIYCHKFANNNVNNEAYMRSGNLPAHYESHTDPVKTTLTASVGASDTTLTVADTSLFPSTGTLVLRPGSTTNQASQNVEFVNYTGKTTTTFTGLTRAQAGTAIAGVTFTSAASNVGTVASATGIQVGQRVLSTTSPSPVPEGTFVTGISGTTITLSQAVTATNPTVIFDPMCTSTASRSSSASTGQAYTFSATSPVSVEFAYPTFAPAISHWGSSVIMDGRYDDDKSLIFTFGTTAVTSVPANSERAIVSIRLAPSVDSGQVGVLGAREVLNRAQLKLNDIGILQTGTARAILVKVYLNGVPSGTTGWTNAVNNVAGAVNSSLAQIAQYTGGSTTVSGGELTGGFFSQSVTDRIDLKEVRDLGNSILGGGTTTSNTQIYPDGPDVVTIAVQNLDATNAATVFARLGWTEAQA